MSTPWKRVVVVGALLFVSLCAAYVTSRTLWLHDYEELETQAALRGVARVRDTVQNELEQLAAAASAIFSRSGVSLSSSSVMARQYSTHELGWRISSCTHQY